MAKFSFKEVAPCLFAIFIDVLGFGLVLPVLIALFTTPEHNIFGISTPSLSYFCLGTTLAISPLCMFFGASFIGDLSDIIGRKKTLVLSMLGMAFSFCLMGVGIVTTSFTLFLFGRGLSGLVAASQSVALATISDLSTADNKAVHLSYVALVECMGFVVGPLMGGLLSVSALYPPFFGAALVAFIAFLWIAFSFEETFLRQSSKTISMARFFKVFVEAYHNRRVRDLSIAFLIMQVGVCLYLSSILILLATDFAYTSLGLGLFNGYLGAGFVLGLLFILPQMIRRFKIEKIVYLSLFIAVVMQFFSSIPYSEILLWGLALLFSLFIEVAFSGMFTAYSNAADENSQGWVMGISVAIMSIAWAIAGFATQFAPLIGADILILIGSLFLLVSAVLAKRYYDRFVATA